MKRSVSLVLVATVAGLVASVVGPIADATPAGAAAIGNPVWSHGYEGWDRTSSPTIADVNGDGRAEIVHGAQDGWLRVLDARTGDNIPHWPQPAIVAGSTPTAIDSTPAVADLDGDGRPEIAVGVGSTWVPNQQGGVVVFRTDGSVRCRYRTADAHDTWPSGPPDGYTDGVYSSPAIGDVNGDRAPDIVFGGFDLAVHAIDRNCHTLSGFPHHVDDTTWSSPALYDVDRDGRKEIFIGSDQTPGGTSDWRGGEFRALDWTSAGVRELWRRRVGDVVASSGAIADVNGDGRLEVVVGTGDFYHHPDGRKVWAFDLAGGGNVAGWPVSTGGATFSSPAIADLDGNGRLDVVIGSRDGRAWAFRGNGSLLWQHQLRFNTSAGGPVNASPVVGDLDGDGRNEVGLGNDWGFFVLDGRTGAEQQVLLPWFSYEATGAIGNFGNLGWRLVIVGIDTPHHTSRIAAFSIPKPRSTPPWPMFRKTAAHLGGPQGPHYAPLPPNQCGRSSNPVARPLATAAKGYYLLTADGRVRAFHRKNYGDLVTRGIHERARAIAPTPSGRGYWLVSDQGGVYTFGDARFFGSMGGRHLNGPIVGVETTPTGRGYWLLGYDGGVFSFGDARFYGSMGGVKLNAPIVSMKSTAGHGYWLLALDGGVFSFGDAQFHGSTGGMRLSAPVTSMGVHPGGLGYWLFGSDGGVFSFDVPYLGSVPGLGLCLTPQGVQIRPTGTGRGYYIAARSGEVYAFGDAPFYGAAPGRSMFDPVVDLAVVD